MKDKYLRATLFGPTAEVIGDPTKCRVSIWKFPSTGNGDPDREMTYPSADGLILALIKRIEKLEEKSKK
jgi:hypothetical protein